MHARFNIFSVLAIAAVVLVPFARPVHAVSPDIVITQVYGGGGNSGATYTNDFVEIFNRGSTPVSISGWSIQYASSTGSTWQLTALSGTIQAGGHYLIQQSQGAGGTTPLPTPDAIGTIAMSAVAGKVALVNTGIALTGACPIGMHIVDFVGYGSTANCFEGSGSTPTLSNTTAALRINECLDTDDNAADFAAASPNPRNSAAPLNPCAQVNVITTVAHPAVKLAPAYPNPARSSASIRFALAEEGHATLSIHDLAGRRAKLLVEGQLSAGWHESRWDGTTDGGAQAPAGVYFCELRVDGRRVVQRMVFLR